MIIIFLFKVIVIATVCGVGLVSLTISLASLAYLRFGWGDGTITIHDKYGSGSSTIELVDSVESALILLFISIVCFVIIWIKHQSRRPSRYASHKYWLWSSVFLLLLIVSGVIYYAW